MQQVASMTDKTPRQRWMSVLAKSPPDTLENTWQNLPTKPAYRFLRPPETGLVMVRARAGGSGMRFNLGEMSMTRCVIQLDDGGAGYSYIAGRSHRHAELAAVFDGLLQSPSQLSETLSAMVDSLEQAQHERQRQRAAKAAATKVDFFTLVRGHS
jgi:alpha-D-ribose 1-methylphosphonate 5-triphosphate synthase subunit PhnG